MIKRTYFYSIKWNHMDGSQSYSFVSGTAEYKSLFANPTYVLEEAKKNLDEKKEKFKGGMFEIVSFNRI